MTVTRSTGNVFADLEFDNPAEELAKADLAIELGRAIQARGLSDDQAARLFGATEKGLVAILRGKTETVTYETLFGYLNRLGYQIQVNVQTRENGAPPFVISAHLAGDGPG